MNTSISAAGEPGSFRDGYFFGVLIAVYFSLSFNEKSMEKTFTMHYEMIERAEGLSPDEQKLFTAADQILATAYAPYSGFSVGAALLLDNGQVVSGSNQENASYSLCLCAERVALFSSATRYPEAKPLKMAVVAHNPERKSDQPIPPCGACRQVILEFEYRFDQPIEILLRDDYGKYYRFHGIRTLLPFAFDGSFLHGE